MNADDLSGVQNEIIDLPEPPQMNRTLFLVQKTPEIVEKEMKKTMLAMRFKKTLLDMGSQDRYFIIMKAIEMLNSFPSEDDIITMNWFNHVLLLNSSDILSNNLHVWETLYTVVCKTKSFKRIVKVICSHYEN